MMQTAEDRRGNHSVIRCNLMPWRSGSLRSHTRIGNPRSQTRVRSGPVVVSYPFPKNPSQVSFVQRNHEIQALPPDGPYQPFTISVCLWRPHRRLQNLQAHRLDSYIQIRRIDAVPFVAASAITSVSRSVRLQWRNGEHRPIVRSGRSPQ